MKSFFCWNVFGDSFVSSLWIFMQSLPITTFIVWRSMDPQSLIGLRRKSKNSSTPLAIPRSVNAIWIVYNFRHVFSVILVKLTGQVLHIMQQVHLPLSSNIQMHKYVIWWTHRHTDRGWKVQLHSCFQGQRTSEREEKLFCLLQ